MRYSNFMSFLALKQWLVYSKLVKIYMTFNDHIDTSPDVHHNPEYSNTQSHSSDTVNHSAGRTPTDARSFHLGESCILWQEDHFFPQQDFVQPDCVQTCPF